MYQFKRYHEDGSAPLNGEVFVFGSNLAGIHGAGAAKVAAARFGAAPGVATGRQGQSYAIATKDRRLQTLSPMIVRDQIDMFIDYANEHPDERFFVTRIGCGLAGHHDSQIAPYFVLAPANCSFAEQWKEYLEDIRYAQQR